MHIIHACNNKYCISSNYMNNSSPIYINMFTYIINVQVQNGHASTMILPLFFVILNCLSLSHIYVYMEYSILSVIKQMDKFPYSLKTR